MTSTLATAPAPIRRDPHAGFASALVHALYDAAWIGAIACASPWWMWRAFRDERFAETIFSRAMMRKPALAAAHDRRRVLVHGVSVGETKCAEGLVRSIERAHPELEIVISATTASGAAMATKLHPHLAVVRFPFDTSFSVDRFFARIDPAYVVLVELEVWPNFLRCANRRGVPVAVVNGRVTERSRRRYARWSSLAPEFDRISLLCAQDAEHARRFESLGVERERVCVTGNMKYDALTSERTRGASDLERVEALLAPRAGQALVVAGSTHAPEERIVAEAWREAARDARLVIVPRHVERATEIARELEMLRAGTPQLLSQLRAGEPSDPTRPAIVDSVGELERIYALADVVFVGGSLTARGGQNVLEPAARAKPVIHGPNMANFPREARLLAEAGASVCVDDGAALARAIRELLADPARRAAMGAAGRAAVLSVQGATQRTLDALSACCFGVDSRGE